MAREQKWSMDSECTSNYVCCRRVYPNKPLEHGLKRFFYQCIGWHWDTTNKQSKKGHHPPWYNAACHESISQHKLEQNVDDIPMERDPRLELQLEEEVQPK